MIKLGEWREVIDTDYPVYEVTTEQLQNANPNLLRKPFARDELERRRDALETRVAERLRRYASEKRTAERIDKIRGYLTRLYDCLFR